MSEPSPSNLIRRLECLLAEAADDMGRSELFRQQFPLSSRAFDDVLSRALVGLSSSLRARPSTPHRLEPISPRSELPVVRTVQASHGQEPETVVIVPLGNPDIELQQRCLLSVARNFDPNRTMVLLFSRANSSSMAHLLADFQVVELHGPGRFSLPNAYTHCLDFLRERLSHIFPRLLLVFMDDDAEIVGLQHEMLGLQMERVRSGSCVLASGHYYDASPATDLFSAAIECSGTSAFAAKLSKPYCHGGAAMMLLAERFPPKGLPEAVWEASALVCC
jgi:hypothetical protein